VFTETVLTMTAGPGPVVRASSFTYTAANATDPGTGASACTTDQPSLVKVDGNSAGTSGLGSGTVGTPAASTIVAESSRTQTALTPKNGETSFSDNA